MNKDRIIKDLQNQLEEAEEDIEYNVRRKEELKKDIENLEEELKGARNMYGTYFEQCKNLANSKREVEARLSEVSLEKCKLAESNKIKTEEISKLNVQHKTLITNNLRSIESLKEDRSKL